MWELTVYQKKYLENLEMEVEHSVQFKSDDLQKMLNLVEEMSSVAEVGKTRFSLKKTNEDWKQHIIPRGNKEC